MSVIHRNPKLGDIRLRLDLFSLIENRAGCRLIKVKQCTANRSFTAAGLTYKAERPGSDACLKDEYFTKSPSFSLPDPLPE